MGSYVKRSLNWVLFLVLILVVVVGLWFYNGFLNHKLTEQNERYLLEISYRNADAIKIMAREELDTLEAIVNVIGNSPDLSLEGAMEILSLESRRQTFVRLGIADFDGNVVATDGVDMNIMDRDYFKKALMGNTVISDRLVDKIDGGFINVFAVPLYISGKVEGVVIATIDNKKFSDILNVDIFSGEGFAYVIKQNGKPVVYPKHKNSLTEFDNFFEEMRLGGVSEEVILRVKNDMALGKSGVIEYSRNDVARIATYCPSNVSDWYVFSVVPRLVVLHTTNSILASSLFLTFGVALVFSLILCYNIYIQRKHLKALEEIAFTDELTGALTLAKFKLDAQRILEEHPDNSYIIVKLDIAGFKLINDQFGFVVGDCVIKNLARAISLVCRGEDEVFARVGSDEFVMLFRFYGMDSHILLRRRLIDSFNDFMGEFDFSVKFPTGRYLITSFNDVKDDSVSIFEKVNFAHRKAKESSLEMIVDYDEDIKRGIFEEKEIEGKMEAALLNDEFKLFLQPKYLLKDESIGGAEALVRWKPAGSDMIFPNAFIPIFEKNGFIVKLDMFMLEQSCRQIRLWLDQGFNPPTISVNFSRLHLHSESFVEDLCDVCDRFDVSHSFIEIEITESTMMENEQLLCSVLERLHYHGFSVSMDDFGTGYSSLGFLRNIPIDVIKIDRSFFLSAHDNIRANAVLANVLRLAIDLNIKTVAEGVEEKAHVDMLRNMGCDMVQGYYFAKPMSVFDFQSLL